LNLISKPQLLRNVLSHFIAFFIVFITIEQGVHAAEQKTPKITFTQQEKAFINDHPIIVVGGEEDWPPFDFVEDGEYKGAVKEYLLLIEQYTGLRFDIRTGFTWAQLLNEYKHNRLDMLPALYWNEGRTEFINYTTSYQVVRQYIFVDENTVGINSMKDLNHKTVAVVSGYVINEILEEKYPDIRILDVDTPLDAIDAVLTKRADALIDNSAAMSYVSKQHNIKLLKSVFASELEVNNIHMGVRKDWPILRDIVQKGLDAISADEK
jgi:two-component system sensor histidine kinase EvgS